MELGRIMEQMVTKVKPLQMENSQEKVVVELIMMERHMVDLVVMEDHRMKLLMLAVLDKVERDQLLLVGPEVALVLQ